jgi:hypothetical protein
MYLASLGRAAPTDPDLLIPAGRVVLVEDLPWRAEGSHWRRSRSGSRPWPGAEMMKLLRRLGFARGALSCRSDRAEIAFLLVILLLAVAVAGRGARALLEARRLRAWGREWERVEPFWRSLR